VEEGRTVKLSDRLRQQQETADTEDGSEGAGIPDGPGAPDPFARPEHAGAPDPFARPEHAGAPDPFARPEREAAPDPFARPEHAAAPDRFEGPDRHGAPETFDAPDGARAPYGTGPTDVETAAVERGPGQPPTTVPGGFLSRGAAGPVGGSASGPPVATTVPSGAPAPVSAPGPGAVAPGAAPAGDTTTGTSPTGSTSPSGPTSPTGFAASTGSPPTTDTRPDGASAQPGPAPAPVSAPATRPTQGPATRPAAPPPAPEPARPTSLSARAASGGATALRVVPDSGVPGRTGADPFADLKSRAHDALFARLGSRLFDSSLSESQLRSHVVQEIGWIMEGEKAPLSAAERQRIVEEISDDVLGHGPIEKLLADASVTEIMVNSVDPIYVERHGKLERTDVRFMSQEHLRRVIERIVSKIGRRIDESSPMVDARLADGSRVNAVIPPLSVDGPSLTIRKFSKDPYQVDDLIGFGTMTQGMADLLTACVTGKLNVLVTGGTGTGKTTLLNVLSGFIPAEERIVTIEDAVELQLHQDHVVRLESRPANIEGKGSVTIRDLVRNSLRMRPDRIVVGEVRGGEALDMLQAMNTGHDGSLSTVHANTPRDALARLETMVLMAGLELPARAIREQIASALDLIVQLTRLRDGTRRITHVTEVEGMENDTITLSDVFLFDYSAGIGPDGKFLGAARPTGIRPKFSERLNDLGIQLPAEIFGDVDILAHSRAGRFR